MCSTRVPSGCGVRSTGCERREAGLDLGPMEDLSRYRLEVELRDGTPAVVRAIRPEDKDALRWGFGHLSPHAIYHRFFQAKRELTDTDLQYLTEVDFVT